MSSEVAVIETALGNIELEFLEDIAPGHTQNFKAVSYTHLTLPTKA